MPNKISEIRKECMEKWIKIHTEWEQSELNQTAYCKQNGVNLRQFQYWHRKLRKDYPPEKKSESNMKAKIVQIKSNSFSYNPSDFLNSFSPLKVQIGELSVEVTENFHPETLLKLIRVLKVI
jgi:hypothetical protein